MCSLLLQIAQLKPSNKGLKKKKVWVCVSILFLCNLLDFIILLEQYLLCMFSKCGLEDSTLYLQKYK